MKTTFKILTSIVAIVIIILCLKEIGKINTAQEQSQRETTAFELHNTSESYEHRARLFADSALNFSGPVVEKRMPFWVRGAIINDSLSKRYADSAKKTLLQ